MCEVNEDTQEKKEGKRRRCRGGSAMPDTWMKMCPAFLRHGPGGQPPYLYVRIFAVTVRLHNIRKEKAQIGENLTRW